MNSELIPASAPGSGQGSAYEFVDEQVEAGTSYHYWLQDVNTSGESSLHGPISATANSPTALTLQQLESRNAPPAFMAWFFGLLAALGLVLKKRTG